MLAVFPIACVAPAGTPPVAEATEAPIADLVAEPTPTAPPLPAHPPAVPTPLIIPEGALDHFFQALEAVEAAAGQGAGPVARILSWGDSTIAGDGIVSTVRERLQAELGDGGPGFLTVHVDPEHAYRHGVAQWTEGDWESLSITLGGAPSPRYGLAGIVSTASGEARSVLGGLEREGQRQLIQRFDIYYQLRPGGGSFTAGGGAAISTEAAAFGDRFLELRSEEGWRLLALQALGDGPVSFYGVALETDGPGVTWETFGVAGSGVGSMSRQAPGHLRAQIARRDPDLVVYWTGANEWGYESVTEGDGAQYQTIYQGVVETLRGDTGASCLLIGPLDQGRHGPGDWGSEPALGPLIAVQERAAAELGCAYWDARAAMGGEGSFRRWLEAEPPLALPDRLHLSDAGKALIGESLADAILHAFRYRSAAQ